MTTLTAAPAAPSARYDANVRWFMLFRFFGSLALWAPIWVRYLQEQRGLSLAQVTAMEAPFWLVIVLSEVPTGVVADRWGRRASMLLGVVFTAAATLVFGLAANFPLLLLSYLIWSLSMTLTSGADTAFLYDTLAANGREGEFRRLLGRANALEAAAFMAGALIGAPLAAVTTLNTPVLATAAISGLTVFLVLRFKEPPGHHDQARLSYRAIMTDGLRYVLAHRQIRTMMALRAVLLAGGTAGFVLIQPFLAAFDVPVGWFGVLSAPNRVGGIVGGLVAYQLARQFHERTTFWLLLGITALSLLALGVVPSVVIVTAFITLNFSNAVLRTLADNYINERSPSHLRATVMSVGNMAMSVVLAVALPSLGYFADRAGVQPAFTAAAVAGTLLGTLALLTWTLASRRADPLVPATTPVPARE